MKGYVQNIKEKALTNESFRQVLYTDPRLQLVVMSLLPQEEIGVETHQLDQFIRVEAGEGKVILDDEEYDINKGTAIVVPSGVQHNLINTATHKPMKLYTIYTPPDHQPGVVHATKADAEKDEEHYEG